MVVFIGFLQKVILQNGIMLGKKNGLNVMLVHYMVSQHIHYVVEKRLFVLHIIKKIHGLL